MEELPNSARGIRIMQKPGGDSQFTLDWGYRESPLKKIVQKREITNLA